MKKNLLFVISLALAVLFIPKQTLAQTTTEQIQNFSSQIQINQEGTINITETLDYYFPDERHGIYRDIPITKTNQDGKKYKIEITDIEVSQDGTPATKNITKDFTEVKIRIGDADKTISGLHQYVINYKVSGAITYFSEHDELYWDITGDEWQVPIEKATATILFPESEVITKETLNTACYTGLSGSAGTQCTKTTELNPIRTTFETTSALVPGEGFTIVTGIPKGVLAELTPEAAEEKELPLWASIGILIATALLILAAIGFYLVFPIVLLITRLKRSKNPLEQHVGTAWFDIPKINGEVLTAGEAGTLYDRSADIRDMTATIVQLAQKGFLKIIIEEKKVLFTKNNEVTLEKLPKEKVGLKAHEKEVMNFIFESKDVVKMADIGKRSNAFSESQKVLKNMEKTLSQKAFDKDLKKDKNMFVIFGALGTLTLNILLIIVSVITAKTTRRNDEGARAYAQIKSFYNFIKTQKEELQFQAENQMMFEKFLPYAIALGVEDIWIKRFEKLNIQNPEYIQSNNLSGINSFAVMNTALNTAAASALSTSSTRSSSGFSSGFSGGGFSGGGGGGGGGGSW